MSHLEKQISTVRSKLQANLFINALAWGAVFISGIALLAVTIDRLFAVSLPAEWRWPIVLIGMAAWIIAAISFACLRRPTRAQAAVAIDDKLGLKERFSTAVYVAPSSDQFAMAALHDAHETARQVDLKRQFPLKIGGQWRAAATLFALALAAALFLPRFYFFSGGTQLANKTNDDFAQQNARAAINNALAIVSSAPRFQNDEFDTMVDELRLLSRIPKINDPDSARRLSRQAIELSEEITGKTVRPPNASSSPRPTGQLKDGDKIDGQDVNPGEENRKPIEQPERPTSPDRPLAKDRIPTTTPGSANPNNTGASSGPNQPNPAAGNNPRPGNPGNAQNPQAGNIPGQAKDGNTPGQPNNGPNQGPGPAAPGKRDQTPAPFATKEEHSPSQENPDGRILARDVVKADADVGKQTMTMAQIAKAAREQAADEVDAEHVSGPAQSAARKYFRTKEPDAPAK